MLVALTGFISLARAGWVEIPLGFQPAVSDHSPVPAYEIRRPTIGLVLSGGGARGLAQIGVLRVFERHGLPVDCIAGTSMGAVIGGLFAVGYSASDLETIAGRFDWNKIIRDSAPRQELFLSQKAQKARALIELRLERGRPVFNEAYTSGHRLNALLTELIYSAPHPPSQRFDCLKIPFLAVATDLLTGEKKVFREGSLVDAIHASMAIPLLFEPVPIDGHLLVDGGLVQNLPVEEIRVLDPDWIIAVDTSSRLRRREDLRLPWQVADQVTTILHQETLNAQLEAADIQIRPELGDLRNTDFSHADSLIQAGVRAAEEALPRIEALFSDTAPQTFPHPLRIASVSVEGAPDISPDSLMALLAPDSSSHVSVREIIWQGRSLYHTGAFEEVRVFADTLSGRLLFRLTPTPVVTGIVIRGNTLFPIRTLTGLMETRPGAPLDVFQARRDCARLLQHYHAAGYSLAALSVNRIDNGIWEIVIDEGIISRIRYTGAEKTRMSLIERDMRIRPGDLFTARALTESIHNLYATEYYESIRFHIEKSGDRNILFLHFREKPFSLVRFGLRYDLERQTRGFLEYAEENIVGLGLLGTLSAGLGPWDRNMGVKLETDRVLNTLWTFESRFNIHRDRYRYYEKNRQQDTYIESGWRGALSLGRQMEKVGTVWIRIGIQKTKTEPAGGEDILARENVLLTHLALLSVVDTRDRVPFPRTGRYYRLEYETALPFLGSEVSYFKLLSSIRMYRSLRPRWTVSPHIEWGTVDMTAPFTKQFRVGGLDGFMGLPLNGRIGRRFIVMGGTLRYQMPWLPRIQQYLSLRYDLGGVWGRYAPIGTNDFFQGIGLVYSANTPLGPGHVGWGRMSDGISRIYFSLGYTF